MGKFMNFGDVVVIGFSAYLFVWGANKMLRALSMSEYQA